MRLLNKFELININAGRENNINAGRENNFKHIRCADKFETNAPPPALVVAGVSVYMVTRKPLLSFAFITLSSLSYMLFFKSLESIARTCYVK